MFYEIFFSTCNSVRPHLMELLSQIIFPQNIYFGCFKWSCKIHIFLLKWFCASIALTSCFVSSSASLTYVVSPNSLSILPCSKLDVFHCLTEPQTGTLDTVQWLPLNANGMEKKRKFSDDFLLCLCVAVAVKPLFDHSQWILLSQSHTSTPTVLSICGYSKKIPPIYSGLLN